jgi:galactokinase
VKPSSLSTARAPGRVNVIGEHTDYNDGFVMPAAIGYETVVDAEPREDRILEIESRATSAKVAFSIDTMPDRRAGDWTDYARGVLIELERAGVALQAASLRVGGDLPLGAGLSSSASFEVALTLAMLGLSNASMDRVEIAKLCRRAETEHVGARAGIMDQFVVLFGRAHCVVLLDTRSLEWEHLQVPGDCSIVICNTMVRHELARGEYNVRREQCERAVEALRRWYPEIAALRDVSLDQLQAHESGLSEVLFRRARHVIGEIARTLEAAAALRKRDLLRLGALVNASHESLRTDYEVSSPELDAMVEIARRCHGVYGARMTGGGFGGCTVNLVESSDVRAFRERVGAEYRAATGIAPEFYDGTPVNGASYE